MAEQAPEADMQIYLKGAGTDVHFPQGPTFPTYKRAFGEAMARLGQMRLGASLADRRATSPDAELIKRAFGVYPRDGKSVK